MFITTETTAAATTSASTITTTTAATTNTEGKITVCTEGIIKCLNFDQQDLNIYCKIEQKVSLVNLMS